MPRRKSGGDAATQSVGTESLAATEAPATGSTSVSGAGSAPVAGSTPAAGSASTSESAPASGSTPTASPASTSGSAPAASSTPTAVPPTFIHRVSRKIHNRTARLASWRWRHTEGGSQDPIIVIGGCPRSGTTLLRRLLDEHPAICCGPESNTLLPGRPNPDELALSFDVPRDEVAALLADSDSQAAFVAAFFGRVAEARGKRRWAEKTPLNIAHLGWVLSHFPRARVIHVVRDGRDVVCSLRHHPVRRFVDGGWKSVPQNRSVVSCTRQWLSLTGKGMDWRTDGRYLEVRYEDLVDNPEATLRRVMAFLEEPFDPEWLRARLAADGSTDANRPNAASAITNASIGRWVRDLSLPEKDQIRRLATDRLLELDYITERDWR